MRLIVEQEYGKTPPYFNRRIGEERVGLQLYPQNWLHSKIWETNRTVRQGQEWEDTSLHTLPHELIEEQEWEDLPCFGSFLLLLHILTLLPFKKCLNLYTYLSLFFLPNKLLGEQATSIYISSSMSVIRYNCNSVLCNTCFVLISPFLVS